MIADEIYTLDELRKISGYRQPKRITHWLSICGIPYIQTPSGIPRVHRLALAHRMGAPSQEPEQEDGPDLSKVR